MNNQFTFDNNFEQKKSNGRSEDRSRFNYSEQQKTTDCKSKATCNSTDTTCNSTDTSGSKAEDFTQEFLLLDFMAPWCGYCRSMAGIVDDLERDESFRLKVKRINVDEDEVSAKMYHVRSLPTFVLLRQGRLLKKHVGTMTRSELRDFVQT